MLDAVPYSSPSIFAMAEIWVFGGMIREIMLVPALQSTHQAHNYTTEPSQINVDHQSKQGTRGDHENDSLRAQLLCTSAQKKTAPRVIESTDTALPQTQHHRYKLARCETRTTATADSRRRPTQQPRVDQPSNTQLSCVCDTNKRQHWTAAACSAASARQFLPTDGTTAAAWAGADFATQHTSPRATTPQATLHEHLTRQRAAGSRGCGRHTQARPCGRLCLAHGTSLTPATAASSKASETAAIFKQQTLHTHYTTVHGRRPTGHDARPRQTRYQ